MKTDRRSEIISVLLFAFMLAIYAPMEVYLTNKGYFFFPGTDMLGTMAICFMVLIAVCTVVLMVSGLLGQKVYNVIYGLFTGGILGLYIQGNWDITDYGAWNGEDIEWNRFVTQMIVFAVIWLIIFTICTVLSVKKHELFRRISGIICGFIGLILLFTMIVLLYNNGGLHKEKEYIATTEQELQLSRNENMLIIVADTFDGQAFYDLIEDKPEYAASLDGFTFYRDTMGAYTSTDMSLPMIVTGSDYRNEGTYGEYLNKAYAESELINWLSDHGWENDIYTDMLMPQDNERAGVDNSRLLARVSSDNKKLMGYIYRIVLFRYFPQPLKRYFVFYPDNLKTELCTFAGSEYEAYGEDNLAFRDIIPNMTADKDEGVFQLIHIDGSHPPFYYTEDLEISDVETSYETECEGVLRLIIEAMDKLREKGIYDDTIVLIMGDHGYYINRQNPLLLIKGRAERHDMTVSDDPVSFYDLQNAYIKLLDESSISEDLFDEVAVEARTRAVRSVPWNTHLNYDTYGGLMKEYSSTEPAYSAEGLGFDGMEFAPVDEGGFR